MYTSSPSDNSRAAPKTALWSNLEEAATMSHLAVRPVPSRRLHETVSRVVSMMLFTMPRMIPFKIPFTLPSEMPLKLRSSPLNTSPTPQPPWSSFPASLP